MTLILITHKTKTAQQILAEQVQKNHEWIEKARRLKHGTQTGRMDFETGGTKPPTGRGRHDVSTEFRDAAGKWTKGGSTPAAKPAEKDPHGHLSFDLDGDLTSPSTSVILNNGSQEIEPKTEEKKMKAHVLTVKTASGKTVDFKFNDRGGIDAMLDGKPVIAGGYIKHLNKPSNGMEFCFGKSDGPVVGLSGKDADTIRKAMQDREDQEKAKREAAHAVKVKGLIDSGKAKIALVKRDGGDQIAYVLQEGDRYGIVKTIQKLDGYPDLKRPADAYIGMGEGTWFLQPGEQDSIDAHQKERNEIREAKESKKTQERSERDTKRKAAFDEAKKTGQKQVLSQWSGECNDPNESCDIDNITEWAMPDGTTKQTRSHTW